MEGQTDVHIRVVASNKNRVRLLGNNNNYEDNDDDEADVEETVPLATE